MPQPRPELRVQVLRVFTDDHGDHGNPLGVVLDGPAIPGRAARQEIAYELGFSETVFVDDATTGALQIFTPATELPLAGHPLVGTAWLLRQRHGEVHELRPPAGPVACAADDHGAWIEADPALSPPWRLEQVVRPDDVDAIDPAERPVGSEDYVWAWIDEDGGFVRARCFATAHGIVEDEATGSAALLLGRAAGRPITIHQGRGSRIDARPADGPLVRVGGRVVHDEEILLDA